MMRYGVGRRPTQMELSEPRSTEAELREQGLRILARWIARYHLQFNISKHNTEAHAARQESAPATAVKRRGRTINRGEWKS